MTESTKNTQAVQNVPSDSLAIKQLISLDELPKSLRTLNFATVSESIRWDEIPESLRTLNIATVPGGFQGNTESKIENMKQMLETGNFNITTLNAYLLMTKSLPTTDGHLMPQFWEMLDECQKRAEE